MAGAPALVGGVRLATAEAEAFGEQPIRGRSRDGLRTAVVLAQTPEPEREISSSRGRFAKGNRLATREYRQGLRRDPHYYVHRWLRDTIAKLRTGKMQPGVGLALIAAFKLELELLDRTQTATTIGDLQNEVTRLSAQLRDLLANQTGLGAR